MRFRGSETVKYSVVCAEYSSNLKSLPETCVDANQDWVEHIAHLLYEFFFE